jgi:competence protein ComEC
MRLRRSTQFLILACTLVAGILLGRQGIGLSYYSSALLAALALVLLGRRSAWIFILMAVFIFGVARGWGTDLQRTPLGQVLNRDAIIEGVVSDDPGRTSKNRLEFTVGNAMLDGKPTHQSVKIQTAYRSLSRGQKVLVAGKIHSNIGSVPFEMYYGQVTVIDQNAGWLESWRQKFFASIHSLMPEPMAGLALGFLVGVRSLLDKNLQNDLVAIGLSHLVAVSGYNLTILVHVAFKSLRRLSLFAATAVSLWMIAGFLLVAGFSASIVRAAIVSGLALLASYYGLKISPVTLIALPAAATLAVNPDYLFRDLGWQLSFLAFAGILILAPAIYGRFKNPSPLKVLIVEAICAQFVTIPLVMHDFGRISLVAPLANMVVLPIVPLAMGMSFLSGLAGMISLSAAAWLAAPTAGLLGLIVSAVSTFNTFPAANLAVGFDFKTVVIIYGLIGLITLILSRRKLNSVRSVLEPLVTN